MTKRICRKFSREERELLRKLWSTNLSDKELEGIFNRHRSVLRRIAEERLYLPPRTVARAHASRAACAPLIAAFHAGRT